MSGGHLGGQHQQLLPRPCKENRVTREVYFVAFEFSSRGRKKGERGREKGGRARERKTRGNKDERGRKTEGERKSIIRENEKGEEKAR